MASILSLLSQAGDLLLVVLGFSLIIVIHELGHFVAARWAKIRVLAFAVGFGPAIVSYRRGLGLRKGSSEGEYKKIVGSEKTGISRTDPHAISTTEYRLNALPFGGYVKMLGQDDADPTARSDEPDSYQNCKTWKRMIVISAGVVANVITAAILFVAVFMLGLRTEPAKIGYVEPGSPAATAVATNAGLLGVQTPGLKSGDRILAIDGEQPLSFNDLMLASMMARRGSGIVLDIERAGVAGPLHFVVTPQVDPQTQVQLIGAGLPVSNKLPVVKTTAEAAAFERVLGEAGAGNVEPGMSLVSIDGKPVESAYELNGAIDAADGKPVHTVFRDDSGKQVEAEIAAKPRLQQNMVLVKEREVREVSHILGLLPVMRVEDVPEDSPAARSGLKPGDVFVQLGSVEWPSIPVGVREVQSHAGAKLRVVVTRKQGDGAWKEVDLGELKVDGKGHIGFNLGHSADAGAWVGVSPSPLPFASKGLPALAPGSRIVAVNDTPTSTLSEVRRALGRAVAGKTDATVSLRVELPLHTRDRANLSDTVQWPLDQSDIRQLSMSPWQPALDPRLFLPEQFNLQAKGPVGAISMGLRETNRVMMTTYLTFARLFQGTVKVEHLRGPVGIAHFGTQIAEKGFVWLMFFMALISVNLAVVNFLPIPIADGGHFVFLLYEQLTGKPVSAAVQNAAAIAGLVLLATMFLIVTYNDIARLFTGG